MKYEEIKQFTRKLRHGTTPEEEKLWRFIRKKQLDGRKFLRQHAIIYETIKDEHFFYVPDFYCFKEHLAIELDGKIHDFTIERDNHRDEILNSIGINIVRFKNEELKNIESVLQRIRAEFKK